MSTNFTFRDFIVYFLTGISFILSLAMIYHYNPLITLSCSNQYELKKDYSLIIILFMVPIVYIIGHLISTIDTLAMKYYIFLRKKLIKNNSIILKAFLGLNTFLFYRQRVAYHAMQQPKNGGPKYSTIEDFWVSCAKLQKENHYSYAEYWYVLNDLFKNLAMVSLICSIISIIKQEWFLMVIFIVLTMLFIYRAIQFAEYFVSTVRRLSRV
jgi:hypothetical protein